MANDNISTSFSRKYTDNYLRFEQPKWRIAKRSERVAAKRQG